MFASKVTKATGGPGAFIIATLVIIVWAIMGPFFNFSDTWQMIINTSTTIITFLMVFIIQHSQNKDTMALQLKLNELIAATKMASNRLVSIEDLSEDELEKLKQFYAQLAELSKKNQDVFSTHSIDEAAINAEEKAESHEEKKPAE